MFGNVPAFPEKEAPDRHENESQLPKASNCGKVGTMTDGPEITAPDAPDWQKHPGGRPSKYDPRFCEVAIKQGRLGRSRVAISCVIGISRENLADWEDRYPEFRHAMDEAMRLSQLWWEQAGQDGLTAGAGAFNAAVWSRSMAARFPRDWRDKHIKVDIPKITDAATLQSAQSCVAETMAKGKVDAEGAATLMTALGNIAKTMEMLDMEKRLIALEEHIRLGRDLPFEKSPSE